VGALVLVVAASLVVFLVPTEAKAGCYTPFTTHTEYYGWSYNNGTEWRCNAPLVGPPIPPTLIGERDVACDGTVTQWGQACIDGVNQVTTREQCAPICD
jgi:hypothetical protein